MKNHYLIALEKEMDRLWIGHQTIAVVSLGKDKFFISDGPKTVRGKGHQLLKITKRLPDRSGADRFWRAVGPLGVTVSKTYKLDLSPTA